MRAIFQVQTPKGLIHGGAYFRNFTVLKLILSFLDYKQTVSRDSTNRVCFIFFSKTSYGLLYTIFMCYLNMLAGMSLRFQVAG